jgi:hypothetical protein
MVTVSDPKINKLKMIEKKDNKNYFIGVAIGNN